ncbi:hypothetical protein [Bacillus cereus]|uniref:Uncharacterized protein n=1 Tax=Bacillus cereus TaxID=1396 RepID=A0AA44TF51_BACCE|nr:hypothetical protein [Bacillus cereus]PFN04198.1 hypothetical protein COJ55_22575 [Bacillus cereus]PFS02560.1 hypothetical protein COK38_09235 [Bacillus cereus]
MNKQDADVMVRLAREGKHISKIWAEDFPEYDYWEVYTEGYGSVEKSSVGVKRMITARLNKLAGTNKQKDHEELIEEINELIFHLYSRYKGSQQKSNEIRSIINNS